MKKRILFVDDNHEVLSGFKRMLRGKSSEWEMKFVTDAAEASKLALETQFDVIVLDISMPGKSGLELLSEWKDRTGKCDFEVIIVTGLEDRSLKSQALELGAADLLAKPVSREDLVARIDNVLVRKSYRDELLHRTEELRRFNETLRAEIELRKKAELSLKNVLSELTRKNRQLEKMATLDQLTKLFNRRYFDLKLGEYSSLAIRFGQTLSCLMCDIDHFKKINDTYGHPTGDKVLQHVAETLTANIRKTDVIARFGGEEFVVLLPNTARNPAVDVAEKLRAAIEQTHVLCDHHDIRMTISIGTSSGTTAVDLGSALVKNADDSLYQAKRMGRNRVCCIQDSD